MDFLARSFDDIEPKRERRASWYDEIFESSASFQKKHSEASPARDFLMAFPWLRCTSLALQNSGFHDMAVHLPRATETFAGKDRREGLGGKCANLNFAFLWRPFLLLRLPQTVPGAFLHGRLGRDDHRGHRLLFAVPAASVRHRMSLASALLGFAPCYHRVCFGDSTATAGPWRLEHVRTPNDRFHQFIPQHSIHEDPTLVFRRFFFPNVIPIDSTLSTSFAQPTTANLLWK